MKQIHVINKISSKLIDFSFLYAVPLSLILILFSHLGLLPGVRTTLACTVQVKLVVQFVSHMRSKCAAHLFLFDLVAVGVADQEVSDYALLSVLDIRYT
jgi:hypothetical protein